MIIYDGRYIDLLIRDLQKIYPKHKISYIMNDCPMCTVLFDGQETSVKISSSVIPTSDPQKAYQEVLHITGEYLCQWRFRDKNLKKGTGILQGRWWEGKEFKKYFDKKKQKLEKVNAQER